MHCSYPNEFNLDSKINTLKAQIKHIQKHLTDLRFSHLTSFTGSHVEETHEIRRITRYNPQL